MLVVAKELFTGVWQTVVYIQQVLTLFLLDKKDGDMQLRKSFRLESSIKNVTSIFLDTKADESVLYVITPEGIWIHTLDLQSYLSKRHYCSFEKPLPPDNIVFVRNDLYLLISSGKEVYECTNEQLKLSSIRLNPVVQKIQCGKPYSILQQDDVDIIELIPCDDGQGSLIIITKSRLTNRRSIRWCTFQDRVFTVKYEVFPHYDFTSTVCKLGAHYFVIITIQNIIKFYNSAGLFRDIYASDLEGDICSLFVCNNHMDSRLVLSTSLGRYYLLQINSTEDSYEIMRIKTLPSFPTSGDVDTLLLPFCTVMLPLFTSAVDAISSSTSICAIGLHPQFGYQFLNLNPVLSGRSTHKSITSRPYKDGPRACSVFGPDENVCDTFQYNPTEAAMKAGEPSQRFLSVCSSVTAGLHTHCSGVSHLIRWDRGYCLPALHRVMNDSGVDSDGSSAADCEMMTVTVPHTLGPATAILFTSRLRSESSLTVVVGSRWSDSDSRKAMDRSIPPTAAAASVTLGGQGGPGGQGGHAGRGRHGDLGNEENGENGSIYEARDAVWSSSSTVAWLCHPPPIDSKTGASRWAVQVTPMHVVQVNLTMVVTQVTSALALSDKPSPTSMASLGLGSSWTTDRATIVQGYLILLCGDRLAVVAQQADLTRNRQGGDKLQKVRTGGAFSLSQSAAAAVAAQQQPQLVLKGEQRLPAAVAAIAAVSIRRNSAACSSSDRMLSSAALPSTPSSSSTSSSSSSTGPSYDNEMDLDHYLCVSFWELRDIRIYRLCGAARSKASSSGSGPAHHLLQLVHTIPASELSLGRAMLSYTLVRHIQLVATPYRSSSRFASTPTAESPSLDTAVNLCCVCASTDGSVFSFHLSSEMINSESAPLAVAQAAGAGAPPPPTSLAWTHTKIGHSSVRGGIRNMGCALPARHSWGQPGAIHGSIPGSIFYINGFVNDYFLRLTRSSADDISTGAYFAHEPVWALQWDLIATHRRDQRLQLVPCVLPPTVAASWAMYGSCGTHSECKTGATEGCSTGSLNEIDELGMSFAWIENMNDKETGRQSSSWFCLGATLRRNGSHPQLFTSIPGAVKNSRILTLPKLSKVQSSIAESSEESACGRKVCLVQWTRQGDHMQGTRLTAYDALTLEKMWENVSGEVPTGRSCWEPLDVHACLTPPANSLGRTQPFSAAMAVSYNRSVSGATAQPTLLQLSPLSSIAVYFLSEVGSVGSGAAVGGGSTGSESSATDFGRYGEALLYGETGRHNHTPAPRMQVLCAGSIALPDEILLQEPCGPPASLRYSDELLQDADSRSYPYLACASTTTIRVIGWEFSLEVPNATELKSTSKSTSQKKMLQLSELCCADIVREEAIVEMRRFDVEPDQRGVHGGLLVSYCCAGVELLVIADAEEEQEVQSVQRSHGRVATHIPGMMLQRLRFVAVPACLLSDLRLVQCPPELLAVGLGRAMSQLPPQSTERSAPGEGMHSRELVLAAIDRLGCTQVHIRQRIGRDESFEATTRDGGVTRVLVESSTGAAVTETTRLAVLNLPEGASPTVGRTVLNPASEEAQRGGARGEGRDRAAEEGASGDDVTTVEADEGASPLLSLNGGSAAIVERFAFPNGMDITDVISVSASHIVISSGEIIPNFSRNKL